MTVEQRWTVMVCEKHGPNMPLTDGTERCRLCFGAVELVEVMPVPLHGEGDA